MACSRLASLLLDAQSKQLYSKVLDVLPPPFDGDSPGRKKVAMSLEISCEEVHAKRRRGDRFLLLDCREPHEWDAVHLNDAQLLPMSVIAERIGELESSKQQEVIVYCHHGGRSLRVANWLSQQGFSNVKSMAGGIDEWAIRIEPGLPRY